MLLVTAVAVPDVPNNAVAPVDGAVKVTVTPLNGLPPESLTVACNAAVNVVFDTALCGVPAVAVMLAGAPGVLVRLKLAVAVAPTTPAVTA